MRLKKTLTEIRKRLRRWGIGLIVLGILHFALAGILDPIWGVVIIILGVLNLSLPYRGMFIANGLALMIVGVLNFLGNLASGGTFWSGFGIMQVIWGIREIRSFYRYAI